MIRVGLTGGIGSGKTTVARVLEQLGVPVYYADARGKWLSDYDPKVVSGIKSIFGEKAYVKGTLDRPFIARQVFSDQALLSQLNAVIHPAIRRDFLSWQADHSDAAYVVMEAAVLLEGEFDKDVDRVVVVTAPEELRIRRTMQRDGVEAAAVQARIRAQMSDAERLKHADDVLLADENELLLPQILQLHEKLIRK